MFELNMEMIKNLKKKCGLPLYIFNEEEFIRNYREIETTFRQIYPNYHICYSYKTNYTPAICKLVKKLGGYAEVVSDMEYELAVQLGYSADKIVYNGPAKGEFLEKQLLLGGILNIDNEDEANRICAFADANADKNIRIGIRVNFDIDAGYTSRFGIDINKIGDMIALLKAHHIILEGIHCHMSRARGIAAWEKRAKVMLSLVERYDLREIRYISLGSGMYGHMDDDLQKQFPGHIPTYSEYANVVLSQFADFYKDMDDNQKPIVFTEPGTTLISKYVDFVAEVEGIKEVRNNEFVLLNCSFHNLGETCQMKNLPIRVFKQQESDRKQVKNANFVGYTCLEQDILYRNYTGNIGPGDVIEFGNVGGYSLVDKPPFIMPNCPMVVINRTQTKVIKRKEKFEDIFSTFIF